HATARLGLLPLFLIGLARSRTYLNLAASPRSLTRFGEPLDWHSTGGRGRILLILTAASIAAGGFTIMMVGATTVFVPQDLTYMNVTVEELHAVNPRLVSLIAHDRAGFGGGVFCCGVTLFFCLWCHPLTRSLWQTTAIAGVAGFGTAILVHLPIGYTDIVHLTPAVLGALMLLTG